MHPECSNCRLRYERAPGYFLGSTYINYALTALTLTIAYVVLHFKAGYDNRTLMLPLVAYCVLFPLLSFRHARALWLAMDCYCDATDFELDQNEEFEPFSENSNSGRLPEK